MNNNTSTELSQSPTVDTTQLQRYGFSFLPVWSRGKKPLINWDEFQGRKPTEAEAQEWRDRWPDANYGIVTGAISGIVVLDIDDMDAAREWIEANGGLLRTPCVRTAKGEHYYFKHPGRETKNGTRISLMCDFRGDGGYVIAPGSVHDTGVLYEWIVSPEEAEYAPLPAWIEEALYREKPEPRRLDVAAVHPRNGSTPYGRKALDDECSAVQTAAEGARNDTLNRAAFSLGQLAAGGELQRIEAETALQQAARACGLPDTEARNTIRSGLDAGAKQPRTAPEDADRANGNGRGKPAADVRIFAASDIGNGERFAARNAGKVLYDHTARRWLKWDGMRWAQDTGSAVHARAKETARAIVGEIQALPNEAEKQREALHKHAVYSEKAYGIRSMLEMARSEPEISTEQEKLDLHPWLFNLQNGTLDLQSGEFRGHRPEDRITKVSPVRFDPAAECPTWTAFLDRIFEGNTETIFFVQQMAGYILTADTREQCFFLLHGTGANGKSTLLNTLLYIMGDYGKQADFETVLAKHTDGGPRNDLAALVGARLVAASEGERGKRLAESMVKQITGGDAITCRKLYGEPFTYKPEFKLLLSTNHRPRIFGTDHAIWRRVRLVPFAVTVPEDEQDPLLADKLRAEASGILNWMLQGLQSWLEKGLIDADSVTTATAAYRGEQDALGPFIDECCTVGEATRAKLKELYETYKKWAEDSGEQPISKRVFSERLTERGFTVKSGTGNAYFAFGLGMKTELKS